MVTPINLNALLRNVMRIWGGGVWKIRLCVKLGNSKNICTIVYTHDNILIWLICLLSNYLIYLKFRVDGFIFNWSLSVFSRKFLESLFEADTASGICVCCSHCLFFLPGCTRLEKNNTVGSMIKILHSVRLKLLLS